MEFVESRFVDDNQITLQCSNVLQCSVCLTSLTKTEAYSILYTCSNSMISISI